MGRDRPKWVDIPQWKRVERWDVGHAIYQHAGIDANEWLYRYVTAERAFEMLSNRKLWFARPQKWDDPHEAWWCEQLFRAGSHLAKANAYGQCWTRSTNDEALWRLYARSTRVRARPAIRLRARAGKLFALMRDAARDQTCKAFMGVVSYCPIEQMISEAHRMRDTRHSVAREAARGLHLKRHAFRFEKEVRLLWIDQLERRPGLEVPFDPIALFDQVMIGPVKLAHIRSYLDVEAKLFALGVGKLVIPSSVFTPPDLPDTPHPNTAIWNRPDYEHTAVAAVASNVSLKVNDDTW